MRARSQLGARPAARDCGARTQGLWGEPPVAPSPTYPRFFEQQTSCPPAIADAHDIGRHASARAAKPPGGSPGARPSSRVGCLPRTSRPNSSAPSRGSQLPRARRRDRASGGGRSTALFAEERRLIRRRNTCSPRSSHAARNG